MDLGRCNWSVVSMVGRFGYNGYGLLWHEMTQEARGGQRTIEFSSMYSKCCQSLGPAPPKTHSRFAEWANSAFWNRSAEIRWRHETQSRSVVNTLYVYD